MKIVNIWDIENSERVVKSPNKDFTSYRYLLKEDNMGYTITITHIPKDNPVHVWHYKNHLESCYCIESEWYTILKRFELQDKGKIRKKRYKQLALF